MEPHAAWSLTNELTRSDGPQPHKLTVYFVKRVGIRDIRFYVDYNEDESYTPTRIVFKSGTSENNLIQFATMDLVTPVGWQQVPIQGAGGGHDGNTLVSYVFQMQILENHQNGKDTHLRGIKIYALDSNGSERNPMDEMEDLEADADSDGHVEQPARRRRRPLSLSIEGTGMSIPDFMRDPEIR
jgi:anaphase-promoting complex subunit 10